ncbi:hypothetical protein [Rhizobium binxianense]|uniref:hypothetical protein n=1 Tax=Rhizobium binxianense TaxID=3024242 RepID=UPI0023607242|nr:hypothetical protein [Rhizobium sp. MJ37]MDC9835919.1 hypothetical protein [Rhizobium sp. MJ37]
MATYNPSNHGGHALPATTADQNVDEMSVATLFRSENLIKDDGIARLVLSGISEARQPEPSSPLLG